MKNLIEIKLVIFLCLVFVAGMLIQSCAVSGPSTTSLVTVPDIISMSKDRVPARDIITDIRKTHTVYKLEASQYTKLQQEGVSDSVVNYMEKTHLDAVRWNQQVQDSHYWWQGNDGYWYGGLGFGWPYGYLSWGLAPSIILSFHDGGHHGGGFRGGRH